MTIPVRPEYPARRRYRFSTRSTARWFVIAALTVCGAGLTLRVLADAAREHPLAAALVVLASLAVAGCSAPARRSLRIRRAARRTARTLRCAAVTAVETAETAEAEAAAAEAEAAAVAAAEAAAVEARVYEVRGVDYTLLDAYEFEQAVADLCERDGCRDVEVVGGAGDLGADVLATAPDGRRVVIQCKRYGPTNKVGSQDMQRFGGTCYAVHQAQLAAVVTTSEYTQPAVEYAEQCGILCFDRQALDDWSAGTGPAPWDTAYDTGDPAVVA
ncbi:restriction endonuclease [Streptomyces sp. NPDC060333]|uniref:restriction endonuclease n=1 Tax=Streptomyces sp. NPDC060333 TaxID=3347098 RepID=UPI00366853B9